MKQTTPQINFWGITDMLNTLMGTFRSPNIAVMLVNYLTCLKRTFTCKHQLFQVLFNFFQMVKAYSSKPYTLHTFLWRNLLNKMQFTNLEVQCWFKTECTVDLGICNCELRCLVDLPSCIRTVLLVQQLLLKCLPNLLYL